MKINSITYHKVFNLGNYSNEKIGIEVSIGENENPIEAHKYAVEYVEKAHLFIKEIPKYKKAIMVQKDPDHYTGSQVKEANMFIEEFNKNFAEQIIAYNGIPSIAMNSDYYDQPE